MTRRSLLFALLALVPLACRQKTEPRIVNRIRVRTPSMPPGEWLDAEPYAPDEAGGKAAANYVLATWTNR